MPVGSEGERGGEGEGEGERERERRELSLYSLEDCRSVPHDWKHTKLGPTVLIIPTNYPKKNVLFSLLTGSFPTGHMQFKSSCSCRYQSAGGEGAGYHFKPVFRSRIDQWRQTLLAT